jgi:amidase
MSFAEYDDHDCIGLAELVRRGEVSPKELLESAIERIEQRNPELNAVVHRMYERAWARVDELPDGPLKGVPFLVKDLKLAIAGEPTSNSCKLTVDQTPDRDSVTFQRYEAAGLQTLGKTNTPEFGLMGITEPKLRGPARNPWNTEHTPGGSSGGSSAAVAARIVHAAHSGDGGGSIRIPGSCCGLFGLKPTRGRITMAPWAGEAWDGFVQEHVLTRSVRDSALLLDLTALPTPGEPYAQPPKAGPWIDEVGKDPGKLTIGFATATLYAGETHPECKAAVEEAAKFFEGLGHEVVESTPPFPVDDMIRNYFLTVAAGLSNFVDKAAAYAGRKPRAADFEPATWLFANIGWKNSAAELFMTQSKVHAAAREIAAWFEEHDVFLSPTIARPPAKVGELYPSGSKETQLKLLGAMPLKPLVDLALETLGKTTLAATPNTQLFNQTGQPAASVPWSWNDDDLPIGIQLAGRFGDEATLFRLAAQVEAERPWADRKPKMIQ